MGIFTRKKSKKEGLNTPNLPPIHIKQIIIENSRDFQVLRQNLQDGNIMVCNISPLFDLPPQHQNLRQKNYHMLQHLKQFCIEKGGSISKLEDHVLLITPNDTIKISR